MVDVIPPDYLPVESKPWAREMQRRLITLEEASFLTNQGNGLALGGINATLSALQQQIAQVASAAASASAAAAAAQAAAAGQVYPATGSNNAAGYTLGTGYSGLCTLQFTTPAGYSQCLFTSQGVVNSLSNRATSESLFSKINIGGVDGPVTTTYFYPPNSGASSPCFSTRLVTGLSTGTVVTITILAALGTASGVSTLSNCTLNTQGIYLK